MLGVNGFSSICVHDSEPDQVPTEVGQVPRPVFFYF